MDGIGSAMRGSITLKSGALSAAAQGAGKEGASLHAAVSDTFQPARTKKTRSARSVAHGGIGKSPVATPFSVDRAQLLSRSADGTFERITKIPCDNSETLVTRKGGDGVNRLYFTSHDGTAINRLNEDGTHELQLELPSGESAGQIEFSRGGDSLYVRTGSAVYRLDPGKGSIESQLRFGRFGYDRRIFVNSRDELLVAMDDKVKVLDGSFNEKSLRSIGFRPEEMRQLTDDTVMFFEDAVPGHILVSTLDGETIFENKGVALSSRVDGPDGKIYFVDNHNYDHDKARVIVRFDPTTNEAASFASTKEAGSVVPLRDGSFIVFDDRLAKPRLILYGADGKARGNVSFPKEGYLRQLYLSEDERTAYLAHTHYDKKTDTPTCTLYRVNLRDDGGLLGKAVGTFSSVGHGLEAEAIHSGEGDQSAFVAGALRDGRIVVMDEKEIALLDPDGKKERTCTSLGELQSQLPPGEDVVTRRVFVSSNAERAFPKGLETLLRAGRAIYGKESAAAYAMPAQAQMPPTLLPTAPGAPAIGWSGSDHSLVLSDRLDEAGALAAMGLNDVQQLESLVKGTALLNFALNDSITVPFGSPGGPGELTVSKSAIRFGGGKSGHSFSVDEPVSYTTILPATTGTENSIFAGTSDGFLHWYDVGSGKERQSYDLGSPPVKIAFLDVNRICAVTASGSVFVLEPKMRTGENLQWITDLSEAGASAGSAADAVVKEEEGVIIIGGVKLEKRARR